MQSLLGQVPKHRVRDDVAHGDDGLEHAEGSPSRRHLDDVADQRQEQRGQTRVGDRDEPDT